nr:hypothetical protein [Tanacetum cinerariifolium]
MDIMNRLPVKSLLQFRVVSKQWKFSIDSFDFIRFRNFDSNLNVFSLKPVASSERVGVGEFSPPYYISQLGDSLIISEIFGFRNFRIIYAWALDFEDGIISSCTLLFTIPHPAVHFLKLLGFSNANKLIVEAEIVQQLYSSLLRKMIMDENFFMERGTSPSTTQKYNTTKPSVRNFNKWRVLKLDLSNLKMDSNLYQLSKMDASFNNKNEAWEYSLDIDDSDLHLTHDVRSSNNTHVKPSPYTTNPVTIIPGPSGVVHVSSSTRVEPFTSNLNPVRIIPGHAGLVQQARLLKEKVFILDPDGALMSTQQYMDKLVEDVGDADDFKSAAWVSATNYINRFGGTVTGCLGDVNNFLKNGKLEQVVGIAKSCSPNMLGDLNVTTKDLSGTIPGTIHHKVIGKSGYGKDITVGAAMILTNVSVFSPNPSKHYLNITMRNVVEVFRKDTVLGNGSG